MEIIAFVFVLFMVAVAYMTFRALKRTLKFALRAIIALLIILAAMIGSTLLLSLDDPNLFQGPPDIRSR